MNIRPIKRDEHSILAEFLYLAVFVPLGSEPPPREVVREPSIYAYIDGFGKPDDICLVAEENGAIVGAAWSRIFAEPGSEGYGTIDAETPELAIAVTPECRGRGIGTQLLDALTGTLRESGYKRVSLSVQGKNPALRLYRRAGFGIVRKDDDDCIMVLDLTPKLHQSPTTGC